MKKSKIILITLISSAAIITSCNGDNMPQGNVDTVNSGYGRMTGSSNIDTGVIVSHDYSGAGGEKGLKDTSGKLGVYKSKSAIPAAVKPDTAKKDSTKK